MATIEKYQIYANKKGLQLNDTKIKNNNTIFETIYLLPTTSVNPTTSKRPLVPLPNPYHFSLAYPTLLYPHSIQNPRIQLHTPRRTHTGHTKYIVSI
jgi:hypothetical protein